MITNHAPHAPHGVVLGEQGAVLDAALLQLHVQADAERLHDGLDAPGEATTAPSTVTALHSQQRAPSHEPTDKPNIYGGNDSDTANKLS